MPQMANRGEYDLVNGRSVSPTPAELEAQKKKQAQATAQAPSSQARPSSSSPGDTGPDIINGVRPRSTPAQTPPGGGNTSTMRHTDNPGPDTRTQVVKQFTATQNQIKATNKEIQNYRDNNRPAYQAAQNMRAQGTNRRVGFGYDYSSVGGTEAFIKNYDEAGAVIAKNDRTYRDNEAALNDYLDPRNWQTKTISWSSQNPHLARDPDAFNPGLISGNQWGLEREADFSSPQGAAGRLTGAGVIKPISMATRVYPGYTSPRDTIPGYELAIDPAKLDGGQLNDLAVLGFKFDKPGKAPTATPAMSQRELALYLGIGANPYAADIMAKQGATFSSAGRGLVAQARELKLNGIPVDASNMKGQKGLELEGGKLTRRADVEAGLSFAVGGLVGTMGGLLYGGDIVGDITENPLSAAAQGAVIAATVADLGYSGAQAINRRFGITNKAFLAKLPDEAFMIDNPSGRLGGFAPETQAPGLELADFAKYGQDLDNAPRIPRQSSRINMLEYEGLDVNTRGLTLGEADLPAPDLRGRLSEKAITRFSNIDTRETITAWHDDLTGLTPHGNYNSIAATPEDIAAWAKERPQIPKLDLTNLAQREKDAAAYAEWTRDFNAEYDAARVAKADARAMSGAIDRMAANGEIGVDLNTRAGSTRALQNARVASYPMSSRGALPNPYYATTSAGEAVNTWAGTSEALMIRAMSRLEPQVGLEGFNVKTRATPGQAGLEGPIFKTKAPQVIRMNYPTMSSQIPRLGAGLNTRAIVNSATLQIPRAAQASRADYGQFEISKAAIKQIQIQESPNTPKPRQGRDYWGRGPDNWRPPSTPRNAKGASSKKLKTRPDRAAWLVKLYPVATPEEMLGFTRPARLSGVSRIQQTQVKRRKK